jgi:hypothetical protein
VVVVVEDKMGVTGLKTAVGTMGVTMKGSKTAPSKPKRQLKK